MRLLVIILLEPRLADRDVFSLRIYKSCMEGRWGWRWRWRCHTHSCVLVAVVILWRRNATISILFCSVAAYVVFQISGYILLLFVSSVVLLLLFVFAKAAGLLSR